MNLKQELQQMHDKLDKYRRKLAAAEQRGDAPVIQQFKREMAALTKRIDSVKKQQTRALDKEGYQLSNSAFHRVLTKAEQANIGELKKKVKGLIVVHPLTKLGKQMGLSQVTGYAPKSF